MISSPGVVIQFGNWIREAERRAILDMEDGRVADEPSLSGRLFESIERVFDEHRELQGYSFRARNVRGVGANAPENTLGADACGLLKVNIPGLQVTKGLLIQSKWVREPHITMEIATQPRPTFHNDAEFHRMQGQCDQMLKVTPDAFVIVYSISGFSVTPASSIVGVRRDAKEVSLYSKGLSPFFKEFLMCFIGDPRITDYDDETLKQLTAEYPVQNFLVMSVSKKVQVEKQ